ncbi:MAG: hypothetical protein C0625_05575 [Arcobacter sp.]|nr:MAG: hypothetical protein C0625_05575 [Arcobacter sp.]
MKILILFLYLFFVSNELFATTYEIKTLKDEPHNKAKNILLDYLNDIDISIINNTSKNNLESVNFIIATNEQIEEYNENIYHEINNFKHDGFIIKSNKNSIIIVGKNKRSLIYGVYQFLETYIGVQFLSSNFEIKPKKITLNIEDINLSSQARFNYREIFIKELDNDEFALKLKLNGNFGHRAKKENPYFINIYNNYSPFKLIPPRYESLYPKYFCDGQLDFSIKKLQNISSENFKKSIKNLENGNTNFYYLPHEDNLSYCQSKESNQINKKHQSTSASVLEFTNTIAKNNPGAQILFEAYQWTRKAPKNFPKLSPNLNVFFSDIEADFSQALDSKKNKSILNDLKSWRKYSDNIFIWHYISNFNGYLQPFPNIKTTAENIKLFDKIEEINSIFLQGAYGTKKSNLANLRAWVFSKLLWNPQLNVQKLITQYVKLYYGQASEEVLEYLELLENSVKSTKSTLLVKTSINEPYLNSIFIKKAKNILEKALLKTQGTPYFNHIIELYSGLYYVELMKGSISNKDKKFFLNYLETSGLEQLSEGMSLVDVKQYLKIKKRTPLVPKIVQNDTKEVQWIDFQEYSLKLCCSTLVEDKLASSHSAVKMKGIQSDWGVQLDLNMIPKGKWHIYANVRIEKNSNSSILDNMRPAIYYGIYPKEIRNFSFFNTLKDEKYHEVKVASLDIKENEPGQIWIRPPEDENIKYIFIDRIFIIKQ